MFKLTTLYRLVDDLAKLDDFFHNTHLQLAEQVPGLLKSEVTRINGKPGRATFAENALILLPTPR